MHSIFGSLINAANMFRQFDNFSNEFHHKYRAYSVTMFDGYKKVDEVNCGGKIIMPNSALEQLLQLNIQYPMLFSISNEKEDNYKVTHCGVLEFVSKEGIVYLPHWMMLNLLLEEGSIITVKNASLSTGKSAVFQPQSESFLAISDPVAVFENALRSFSCLTVGDIIVLKYNNQPYEFEVKNTKPEDKICIIECDLNVEFETPLNYNRDEHQFKKYVDEKSDDEDINYKNSKTKAFEGEYYSIKSSKSFENTDEMDSDKYKTGPIKNYVCGHLQFRRKRYQNKIPIPDDEITDTILFSGEHNTL